MRIRSLEFEGSLQEYEAVRHLFESAPEPAITTDQPPVGNDEYDDVVRVLRRLPIPENHRRLFRVLADAGEAGLTRADLRTALEMNDGELNGILGALGRRINGTHGLTFNKGQGIPLALFLDSWKDQTSEWHYRLRPPVRQALYDEGVLEADA